MTPDARLSAAERAALAHLEAAAAAADPEFAARLKGTPGARLHALALRAHAVVSARFGRPLARLARGGWWGAPTLVAGLVLVVLGVSTGLAVAVVGALACTAGLRMLAGLVERRLGGERTSRPGD